MTLETEEVPEVEKRSVTEISAIRHEMLRLMNTDDEWYKDEESALFKKVQGLARLLENDVKPRKKRVL